MISGDSPVWQSANKYSKLSLRQCSHLVLGHGAQVWFWAPMWTHLFLSTQCQNLDLVPVPEYSTLFLGTKLSMGPCVNTFWVGSLRPYPQFCKDEHVLGLLNLNIFSDWVLCVWTSTILCRCPGTKCEHCLRQLRQTTFRLAPTFSLDVQLTESLDTAKWLKNQTQEPAINYPSYRGFC